MQTAIKHQPSQAGPMQRLNALAAEALAQYHAEIRAGGEPVYPAWIDDVAALASAPVAGEALNDLQALQWAEKYGIQWALCTPDAIREVIADAQSLAAPQASEAVRDAAFEAVRKRLCAIPRYSFYLDDDGVVRRVEGRSGNWIEFDAAHALLDPVSVDAALSAQPGAQNDA